MWFVVIKFVGGGGWSQIKLITFENELQTCDHNPSGDGKFTKYMYDIFYASEHSSAPGLYGRARRHCANVARQRSRCDTAKYGTHDMLGCKLFQASSQLWPKFCCNIKGSSDAYHEHPLPSIDDLHKLG